MRRLIQLPLRIPIFVIVLAVGAILVIRACGPFPGAIKDRNHELLREVAVFPGGAVERLVDIERETSVLPGFGGPTTGVETHRTDRMPAGANGDRVRAWYTGNLSDWTLSEALGPNCHYFYARGNATLLLTACGPVVTEVRMTIDSNGR